MAVTRTSTLVACVAGLALASPAWGQLGASVYVAGLQAPVAFVQDPSNASVQYVV